MNSTLWSVIRAVLFCLILFCVCAMAATASPAEPIEPTIYDVPLSDDLQVHIANLCEEHHIEPEIVIGLIEKESTFNADAVGDNGNSLGLMQIQPKWHKERMERLECDNLLDPFQNVTVGVDILAELIDGYGDTERALMVYNAGATGAYNGWFQYGVYSNEYSSGVLANAAKLTPKEDVEEVVEYIPDHPVVDNLLRTGSPDGKEPRYPVCPHCNADAEQFYRNRTGEIVGCEICLETVQYWEIEVEAE